MKNKLLKFREWAIQNPKKVYLYSIIVILISFGFTTLQYIFFPPEFKIPTLVPTLYAKSDKAKEKFDLKEKEMGKIVQELQTYKIKNEKHSLTAQDSIRMQYLFNQYQKAKNGHQKN